MAISIESVFWRKAKSREISLAADWRNAGENAAGGGVTAAGNGWRNGWRHANGENGGGLQ